MALFGKKKPKKDNDAEKNKAASIENNVAEEKEDLDFTETENTAEQVTEDYTEDTKETAVESSEAEKPEEPAKEMTPEEKQEAYFKEVEEKKKSDPLIGVKLCGRDIFNAFARAGQDPEGKINCNSFLFNIGCFAGYLCQAAVWKKYVKDQNMPVEQVFNIQKRPHGKDFYFSQYTNRLLCEGKLAYWPLTATLLMQAFPNTRIPDPISMFEKVTMITYDENYKLFNSIDPNEAVEKNAVAFKNLYPMISRYCSEPEEWISAVGIAVQNAINISKDVTNCNACFNILMECTIYMSKADISETLDF